MSRINLLALAAALMLAGTPVRASPSVSGMLAELSLTDYQGYVEHLVSLGTRYYGTQGNTAATDYVGQVFSGFGLATREHLFTLDGYQLANVEATLPGLVRPDDIVIIGAHFDSIANRTPGDPSATNAPGADDNASGTAGVLEIASVLSRYQFAQTIRFIGFNAEEQGMIGSQRYAQAAKDAGDNIVAMVDRDMIGYVNDGAAEDLDIMGNGWLVDLMVANVKAFTTLPVTGHVETPMWSDHQYFAAEEYPGSASGWRSSSIGMRTRATPITTRSAIPRRRSTIPSPWR
ncbi:M20/M25/M40 family metallo-hydrolase [uncultured Thiodictyon sp.]|uniref:M28 family metallopeptidase n=1 Tax=uncultured Thiodictyon sp. TaxID=1846217 RepID=UPI0025CE94E2|nr:M20/M25/M40 family metallo-hydrolase [uncultured Thiodictyon sp.]